MNELLFLGTGAADWDVKAENGFYRRNSSVLLNKNLIIDCGKEVFDFAESINQPNLYSEVTDILISHNHGDHLDRESIFRIADNRKIRLGCNKKIIHKIGLHPNIEYIVFEPHKEVVFGEYTVIPLMANHFVTNDIDNLAYHPIVRTPDGKEIFYGLDGAWFLYSTWEEMKKHKFDVMLFDCTVGDSEDWRLFEHNTIPMLRMMLNEIKNKQLLNSEGKYIATHLARTLHKSHEDTEKILKEMDMITAFDGMKIEF